MSYDLWYWSGIPGRGEFVRLPLEAAGLPYREKTWQRDGDAALVKDMARQRVDPPFAPPYPSPRTAPRSHRRRTSCSTWAKSTRASHRANWLAGTGCTSCSSR